MLTRKAFGYLAAAYSSIFLSLMLRVSWLTVFVVPVAILLFYSIKLPKLDPNSIDVTRQIQPARSLGGEDVNVILTVTNRTNRVIGSLLIEDRVPRDLKIGAGTNRMMLSLRRGETAQFEYRARSPQRGNYRLGPTQIRLSDNLGLRTVSHHLSNTDEFIVLPRIEKLGIVDLKGRHFGPWPGLVPSGRIGIGPEFFEIAPYVAGDDLRRVNWKASARSGMLVTNEYEGEQVIDVLIVLDCSEAVRSRLFDYDALEFQVSFAASLCTQLIAQGNRVGLSVYGTVRTWVSPGFGKRHLLRLLDSLALVKPGAASLPIKYVVESVVAAVLPVRSLVLLISPMAGDEVVGMIETLTAKGYNVACFAPSLRTELSQSSLALEIALGIFATERKLRVRRIERMVDVVELSPKGSVKPLLKVRARWDRR